MRILNYCRCALLENNSVIHIFFFPLSLKCHLQLTVSVKHLLFCIFLSNSQTAYLHCGSFYDKYKRTSLQICLSMCSFNILPRCFVIISQNQICVVILKHLNGNLRLPFVSTLLLRACLCGRLVAVHLCLGFSGVCIKA